MSVLIKNGLVMDPADGINDIADVFISGGKIAAVDRGISKKADTIINAEGRWVTPGLIDLHVHLREPGYEYKETIKSGARAAVKGGFTTICCMPNTNPVIDNPEAVRYIKKKAAGYAKVLPIASITVGQRGEELTDMASLKNAGCVGFSEDGKSVMNARLMKAALERAASLDMPVFDHCEDINLAAGGVINEGRASARLSLPGLTRSAEDVLTARDLLLAADTGARIHLCHVSSAPSLDLIKFAKVQGFKVTAETCPHYFSLCDEDIEHDDGIYKVNPPLRSFGDMISTRRALEDNVIDVIATDHAPHSESDKAGGFMKAAFGVSGLETALSLCMTYLVDIGYVSPYKLIKKMTEVPAKILGIDAGTLRAGAPADVTVIDPEARWTVDPAGFYSKGKNTPFKGKTLIGKVDYTLVDGRVVYGNGRTYKPR